LISEASIHLNWHAAVHDVMAQRMLVMLLVLMLMLGMEGRSHLLLIVLIVQHVLHHGLREAAHVDVDALVETVQAIQVLLGW
jgi:hypothetical protein